MEKVDKAFWSGMGVMGLLALLLLAFYSNVQAQVITYSQTTTMPTLPAELKQAVPRHGSIPQSQAPMYTRPVQTRTPTQPQAKVLSRRQVQVEQQTVEIVTITQDGLRCAIMSSATYPGYQPQMSCFSNNQ